MELFRFDKDAGKEITKYNSDFIMSRIIQTQKPAHIGCMHLEENGVIGHHQAVVPQILLILNGEGYVKGAEKKYIKVQSGDAVFWEKDEWHETRTDSGMTAIVIESEELDPSAFMPKRMKWRKTMFPIIETDRLILRKVTTEDAEDMFAYLSDEQVVQHMGLPPSKSVEDVFDEIDWYNSIYKEGTGIRWGITLKGSDKVIGSCGFLNWVPKHHRAEVGFELSRTYWGQGIAGEALYAVVRYGFQRFELERIEALIEPGNSPSQKLVERQGFLREGLLRHYEYTLGKFDDLYMYSILKEDVEGE